VSEPMIVSDPKLMMGKPVVAGTRISVDLISRSLVVASPSRRCSSPTHALLGRLSWPPCGSQPRPFGRNWFIRSVQDPRESGCDEGVDRPRVERLRQDGHNVLYVAELSPSVVDDEVLQQAHAGARSC
jgi:Protein of unknown function (DUF433)